MDPGVLAGWIGGIAGAVIGLLGGVIGTYFSIKNTRGPRERAFMIKAAVQCWILVGTYLAVMLWVPPPYNMLLTIAYVAILVFAIQRWNAAQSRIRQEEQESRV
jgi:CHASE2 domain-containing sensor protein